MTLAQFGWNTTTPACSCRSACLMIHIILSPTTQLRSQAQLLTKRRGKYDLPIIVCKHPFRTSGRSVTWLLRSLSPKPLSSVLHRSWTRLAFTFVVDHRFRASHLRTIRQEICCITHLELWLAHQLNLRHESRWQSWLHESAIFLRNTLRPSSLSLLLAALEAQECSRIPIRKSRASTNIGSLHLWCQTMEIQVA
jgi:hypothetical protein